MMPSEHPHSSDPYWKRLSAEDAKRQLEGFRDAKRFCDVMNDHRRHDIPVEQVNRSEPDILFDLKRKHFTHEQAEALASFRKRHKKSEWMQDQRGYEAKVALAVSSRSSFDGLGYAYCRRVRLCGEEDHCPRCCLEERVKPAHLEYCDVFGKADYWFAAIPSLSYSADGTGLHYVTRKHKDGTAKEYRHDQPFSGPELRGVTLDGADLHRLIRLLIAPYKLASALCRYGLAQGAFATHEIKIEFVPQPHCALEVGEIVIPHGNILLNTNRKPDWHFAQECWDCYLGVWDDLGLIDLAYPDLVVGKAMLDQAEIKRWLSYSLKPLQFEKFYRQGIRAECRLDHLNLHFDQTVFKGIKEMLRLVRSPRKYGNLNSDYRNRSYIGNKPPDRTLQRIYRKFGKCLEKHPDEEPFDYLADSEVAFLVKHGWVNKWITKGALDGLVREA